MICIFYKLYILKIPLNKIVHYKNKILPVGKETAKMFTVSLLPGRQYNIA